MTSLRCRAVLMFAAIFGSSLAGATGIEAVLAHPPVAAPYTCSEHHEGQFKMPGDALGTDCLVTRLIESDGRLFSRTFAGDGSDNDDWYGWNEPLLSPCDCEVVKLHENAVVNRPGITGKPPASFVVLRTADGTHFLLAHIQSPLVAVGDRVVAGQTLARIGNNGYGRTPHVHVGAWRGKTPLQIRWDQRRMQPAR
jgi:hypothetical protein